MNLLIQGSTTQDDDDRTDTSKPHNRRSTIDETGLKESSQHQEASRKARETGSERNSLLLQSSSAPHDDDHTDTNIPHNRRSTIAKIGLKESIIPIESKQEIGHRHKRHRASIPALMAPHYYLR